MGKPSMMTYEGTKGHSGVNIPKRMWKWLKTYTEAHEG
jgi:hypothetical protein